MGTVHAIKKLSSTEAKIKLAELVTRLQGCKATELAVKATMEFQCEEAVHNLLDEMVKDGSIIEVEYILPHADVKIKSFYLPKGTRVDIN